MNFRLPALALFLSLIPAAASAEKSPGVDGGIYSGAIIDGLRQGPGDIHWHNGVRYHGSFEKGQMSGQGRMELPGGHIYEGEFRKGLMHGKGRYTAADRYHYEGEFRNGQFEGQGLIKSENQSYEGKFRNGMPWGKGRQTLKDGSQYTGEFVANNYQGKGRLETANGDIYEGDFAQGAFTGQGRISRKDGSHHEGSFKEWMAEGVGIYTSPDGEIYKATFKQGQISGKGEVQDGKQRYEGEFRNFQPDGEGTLYLENGDIYSGHFSHGLYHGKGILTYATPREGGQRRDAGIWQYGKLEDKAAAKKLASDIESALYQQNDILQKSLASLQPGNTPGGSLFFLGIAGDGSQEVFRRETDFVRQQFDTDFATRSHSITLVNSRSTLLTQPLATLTSIRSTLAKLAKVMRKDDILFVYMTSHGSRQQEFVLNPPGMELANLSADELAALLKESGIRWKVLVISACYSGGFLDALKDDSTLVITAARHDRSSFGCSDENDFTYFGRAYFKEALPKSQSFQEAFQKASALVHEWESKDLKESDEKDAEHFSLPQMQNPPGIESRLKSWWPVPEEKRHR